MLKITLEVEGMHCGMCETHVNDVCLLYTSDAADD